MPSSELRAADVGDLIHHAMAQLDRPDSSHHLDAPAKHGGSPSRGPIQMLLALFSSVWFGVVLLTLLFLYSSIGSAGAPVGEGVLRPWFFLNPDAWIAVRQLRPFEMTDFEWFHWWPFKLLIALILLNIVVATLRRIPFNILNLGVWMIHGGIIVLALGSVWYFGTKVEGEAPVTRRRIVVMAPGMDQPESMIALPGNTMVVGHGENAYQLQVADIDPQWELLSGADKGKKAYKVSVRVQSKAGMFIRDLVANKPDYTQDIIRSNDPKQPMQRAIKAIGRPLVDEALQLSLQYDPQQYFYLMDSRAVYLRELDASGNPKSDWIQRPIRSDLPRYNDYIASADDVWTGDDSPLKPDPIDVAVPAASKDDPLPGVTFHVSRYLRYAQLQTRRKPSPEARLDPAADVTLRSSSGQSQTYQLVAFDQMHNAALQNNLMMVWVNSADALEKLKQRSDGKIQFKVASANVSVEMPVTETMANNPDLPFAPIAGTDYSYRVENYQDHLHIGDQESSVAIVQIKTPTRSYKRWIFDEPALTRDMAMTEGIEQHGADIPLDAALETVYRPGTHPPAPMMVLAGPGEDDLAVMITRTTGQPEYTVIKPGDSVPITDTMSLIVDKYAARTLTQTKPVVVPREQRDRDMREMLSMIKIEIPMSGGGESVWLPYHHFAFSSPEEVLRRFPYYPEHVTLEDGRTIELMFSRERMLLPAPVALDDFRVASHIGGFTGQSSSIMDWTSMITFDDQNVWTEPVPVSMNKPSEYKGYWFFQAQWDPPDRPRFDGDPPSRGLNYTVLGVGNRHGVGVQLAGCVIAVLGMIYTFYAKPIIKRRRQQGVYANLKKSHSASATHHEISEPVGAAWKVES